MGSANFSGQRDFWKAHSTIFSGSLPSGSVAGVGRLSSQVKTSPGRDGGIGRPFSPVNTSAGRVGGSDRPSSPIYTPTGSVGDAGGSDGRSDCSPGHIESSTLVSTFPLANSFVSLGDGREDEGDSDSYFDDYAEGEDGLLLDQRRERDLDPEDFLEGTSLLTEDDKEERFTQPGPDQGTHPRLEQEADNLGSGIQLHSDGDYDLEHVTLSLQGSDSRGNVLNLPPLGSGRGDRDPTSLLGKMGVHFSSPAGDPVEVNVVGSLFYERRKKKLQRTLQQLSSSINYGGKKGRREGGRRV